MSEVEMPCQFIDMAVASSLAEVKLLSGAEVAAEVPAYVITGTVWSRIVAEAATENQDVPSALFAGALGGLVMQSPALYTFTGRQTRDAHVDEIPEDLLGLKHYGMFNIHRVVSGAVTVCMAYTRPGYYEQGTESRTPQTRFNFGITEDFLRRRQINTYTTGTEISEARLQEGDRVIFFERTSRTVDGPPNVVHLFHRGTGDRYGETTRYFAQP